MAYTRLGPFVDGGAPYLSATTFNHIEDGIAVGAALADTAQTLTAGDNIVLTPSAGALQIAAPVGNAAALFTIDRRTAMIDTVPTGTGNLRLAYLEPTRTRAFTKLRVLSGTTAAAATPTLIRYGLYQENPDLSLTLVASTPNDTTLLAAASTAYPKTLTAGVTVTAGIRYAVGVLVVTAATAPTVHGLTFPNAAEVGSATGSRICGFSNTYSDLPATVSAANVFDSTAMVYAALTN